MECKHPGSVALRAALPRVSATALRLSGRVRPGHPLNPSSSTGGHPVTFITLPVSLPH